MDLEYQYLVGKLQEALAKDVRSNILDVKVTVSGGKIHISGEVSTEERRAAVNDIVHEVLPGIPVKNELTVLDVRGSADPEPISD